MSIERAKAESRSLWRASSTCFYHINSEVSLAPVGVFADSADAAKYPAVDAGEQVRQELELIKLGSVVGRLAEYKELEGGAVASDSTA